MNDYFDDVLKSIDSSFTELTHADLPDKGTTEMVAGAFIMLSEMTKNKNSDQTQVLIQMYIHAVVGALAAFYLTYIENEKYKILSYTIDSIMGKLTDVWPAAKKLVGQNMLAALPHAANIVIATDHIEPYASIAGLLFGIFAGPIIAKSKNRKLATETALILGAAIGIGLGLVHDVIDFIKRTYKIK